MGGKQHISATEVAQYVRYDSCDRRLRLAYDERKAAKETVPFADQFFNPLDPVLKKTAARHEDDWAERLRSRGYTELNRRYSDRGKKDEIVDENGQTVALAFTWEGFRDCLRDIDPETPVFAREVEIEGTIGAFNIDGRMDFVILLWESGEPKLRIVETKSSRKEKTNQRLQVAIYDLLVSQELASTPLMVTSNTGSKTIEPEAIECTVGRIEEGTNELQDLLHLDAADLTQEREDVQTLLKQGGHVEDVVTTPQSELDSLDYKLESKCDQCVFDVHCFPETARQRKLELLGLDPTTIEELANVGAAGEGIETIDDLAELDLDSALADEIRSADNIREDIGHLRQAARSRRQNLPGDTVDDEYEVERDYDTIKSGLPEHEIAGEQLIRVYLDIEYDYVEDRVAAAAAHVTKSSWELQLEFDTKPASTADFDSGTIRTELSDFIEYDPDPEPIEQEPNPYNQDDPGALDSHRLSDAYDVGDETAPPVTNVVPNAWQDDYSYDSGTESAMLSEFLQDVNKRISQLADGEEAFIHFYVWSESEMEHLVDACARSRSRLLSDLRELLGSREPTEQLIYSTLQSEIDQRYTLGWTGEGLVVGADLQWFGDIFHWVRNVDGDKARLSRTFTQNIFDFKTDLDLTSTDEWADDEEEAASTEKFELRSRFNDDLPVPYLHAVWNTLPKAEKMDDPNERTAVDRFHRADRSSLTAYLKTRVEALRWLEEHCRNRDEEITKQRVEVPDLPKPERDIDGTAMVARDFLQLDHHMRVSEWLSEHMQPVSHQVSEGEAIPIEEGIFLSDRLRLSIDFSDLEIGIEEFRVRTGFEEGGFAHVCIAPSDITEGPSYRQLTNTGRVGPIENIDWEEGYVDIDVIPSTNISSSFVMKSLPSGSGLLSEWFTDDGSEPPDRFMLVDSVTDFTSRRSYNRLGSEKGTHAFDWFNPRSPSIPEISPLPEAEKDIYEDALKSYDIGSGKTLEEAQRQAVVNGLDTRVQLLLGPPGTGKTTTTATAILTRILQGREVGDFVLLVGSTHRAVNELLTQLSNQIPGFEQHAEDELDKTIPNIELTKVMSAEQPENEPKADEVRILENGGNKQEFNRQQDDSVVIIGGTISSVIKEMADLEEGVWFSDDEGNPFGNELIVDEASMMKFPSFLAVATLVDTDARIMLTGDHRQLSPIVAHEWEEEKRPSVQEYEPHRSAFKVVKDIAQNPQIRDSQVRSSELNYTFRLPPEIRGLIRQLYRKDVDLSGEEAEEIVLPSKSGNPLADVWEQETGLFLVEHEEHRSRVSNGTEVDIVRQLLENGTDIDDGSVAVITPHTAQRARLETELEAFTGSEIAPDGIDTVERFQGGECETVIVSATASDKTAISENDEFLLDLNRANVAFSRAEKRLIVVCSETLLNYIPPEMEEYQSAKLWKTLRRICSVEHDTTTISGHEVRLKCIDDEADEVQGILKEMDEEQA